MAMLCNHGTPWLGPPATGALEGRPLREQLPEATLIASRRLDDVLRKIVRDPLSARHHSSGDPRPLSARGPPGGLLTAVGLHFVELHPHGKNRMGPRPLANSGDSPRQTVQVDEELPGGVANAGQVFRRGNSVLRPSNPNSSSIHAFLRALRRTGFEGASLPVEIQTDGQERLGFIEGEVPIPPYPEWAQADDTLASIAVLMLEFHLASALVTAQLSTWSDELADPSGGPVVCHNDVCLENVVFRDGAAVGLLDFDFAAPGRPIHDLAQFARMCVPIDDDTSAQRLGWNITDNPARLRLVSDTYGLDANGRDDLIDCLDRSMNRGEDFVRRRVAAGDSNFVRMLEAMGGIERYERRRCWWENKRTEFVAALA